MEEASTNRVTEGSNPLTWNIDTSNPNGTGIFPPSIYSVVKHPFKHARTSYELIMYVQLITLV